MKSKSIGEAEEALRAAKYEALVADCRVYSAMRALAEAELELRCAILRDAQTAAAPNAVEVAP